MLLPLLCCCLYADAVLVVIANVIIALVITVLPFAFSFLQILSRLHLTLGVFIVPLLTFMLPTPLFVGVCFVCCLYHARPMNIQTHTVAYLPCTRRCCLPCKHGLHTGAIIAYCTQRIMRSHHCYHCFICRSFSVYAGDARTLTVV